MVRDSFVKGVNMIQFSFGGNNLPQYTIELYVDNTLVEQNVVTPMALEILAMQFAQLCEQIANENEPMKCVCKITREIPLLNGDWVERPARVEFYNNKWGGDMNGS